MIIKFKELLSNTLVIALIIVIGLAALSEVIAHTFNYDTFLVEPSIGSGHSTLEMKFNRLESLFQKEGRVDCIFIGSSVVDRGIDPETFSQTYQSITGQRILCFNFGVGSLNITTARILLNCILKKYAPRLIVLGITPFIEGQGDGFVQRIEPNPWTRYHGGDKNFTGWLIENSKAFRYFLGFGDLWLRDDGGKARRRFSKQKIRMTSLGHSKVKLKTNNIRKKISIFERKKTIRLSSIHLQEMKNLILNRSDYEIVFAEMPLHPDFRRAYPGGENQFRADYARIISIAKDNNVPFMSLPPNYKIPQNAWNNFKHMNPLGAQIYSTWLAKRIAAAVKKECL